MMDCAVRALQTLSSGSEKQPGHGECTPGGISFAAVARRPWDLLKKMDELGLEPDRYTCSTLVKGMHLAGCSVDEIDRAVALLRRVGVDALQSGVKAGSAGGAAGCNARLVEVLFNTLLDACVTARDLER